MSPTPHPSDAQVAEALTRAAARLRDSGQTSKAREAVAKYGELWQLDVVEHWGDALEELERCRGTLEKEQRSVRAMASLESVGSQLDDAVANRDAARTALADTLAKALEMHEQRQAEKQHESKHEEAAALQAPLAPLTVSQEVRIEALTKRVLPVLDLWMSRIGSMREEQKELTDNATRPSTDELRALHEALKKAKRKLRDAKRSLEDAKEDGDDTTEAQAALSGARRNVQSGERALHRERTALAQVAAAHFPELFGMEPLLQLGAADGIDAEELRAVLVERELAHYDDRVRISAKDARHEVCRASYDGEACVLKEYKLDDASEWKLLAKEVRVLGQLSHCPYIASVDAVFVVNEPPMYAAYVQLPYFSGGDMRQWITNAQPEVCRRIELLTQLAHALQYMHERGIAHGDVKLENVLVNLDGERATAHLADFESARVGRADGTQTITKMTTTGAGRNPFTELYVAPEIRLAVTQKRMQDAKPTAMGDMFSYGVCCLFACCLPPDWDKQQEAFDQFDDDDRQLADWSRAQAASANAFLPSLLERLLAPATTREEALDARLDAKQVLTHPFLDTFEAIELARRETAAAELARQAQERESEEERRRLEAEAVAQREAIERERQRHQQQMRHREQAVAADKARQEAELRAERRANEEAARQLQQKRDALELQEAEVARSVAEARERASALAAKQREIRAEEAQLQREDAAAQARLATLQREQQEMQRGLSRTREEHARKASELDRLKRELVARETSDLRHQPHGRQKQELRNSGADVAEYLSVVDRVEKYVQADHNNPIHVIKIEKVFNRDLEQKFRAAKASNLVSAPKDCITLQLFHGTNQAGVEGITTNGFRLPPRSDRNMFGQGVYFATDSTKSAQEIYTKGSNRLLLCDVHLGKSCTVKSLTERHPLANHVKQATSVSPPRPYLDVDRAKVREAGYDSVCAPRGGSMTAAGVKFDEYIVYDPNQAIPRYIVHYGKFALGAAQPRIAAGARFAVHQLTPQRHFDPKNELDMHFRICESHLLRQLGAAGKKLVKVEYIVNPELIRQFEQQQKDFERNHIAANMVLAFHGTRDRAAVDNIVRNNFDPNRIGSQTDSGWWGRGFYFSEFPSTSLGYGSNMLLCRVLPGKTFDVVDERMDGQPLRTGFNSHRLRKDNHGYGQELVIDNPKQILPCYILHIQ